MNGGSGKGEHEIRKDVMLEGFRGRRESKEKIAREPMKDPGRGTGWRQMRSRPKQMMEMEGRKGEEDWERRTLWK